MTKKGGEDRVQMATMNPPRAYDEVVAFFASGPTREEIKTFRLCSRSVPDN